MLPSTSRLPDPSREWKEEGQEWEDREGGVVISVVGGCGFLGRHLIKLLHTHGYNIKLIKVLDLFPFEQKLTYQSIQEVQSVVGSITCIEDLLVATAGATTVFHLASLTDRSMFPDHQLMDTVNIEGTQNVIKACQVNGVQNLIYASDVSVVMGTQSINRGNEITTWYPLHHVLEDGPSKAQAEQLVLEANGLLTGEATASIDPPTLKTLSLRLVNLFGELDSLLWPRLIQLATWNEGHVPCVGNPRIKGHMMYVGNAAWALLSAHHVLTNTDPHAVREPQAMQDPSSTTWIFDTPVTTPPPPLSSSSPSLPRQTLDTLISKGPKLWMKRVVADVTSVTKQSSDVASAVGESSLSCSQSYDFFPRGEVDGGSETGSLPGEGEREPVDGKVFYVCDDTPPANYFVFMRAFLKRYGFFLTSWSIAEKWAKRLMKIAYVVLWLLFPFVHINPPLSLGEIHQVCRRYTFSCRMANEQLRYSPLYSFARSIQHTVKFYDNEYKEALSTCLIHRVFGSVHVSAVKGMTRIKKEIDSLNLSDSGQRFRGRAAQDAWKNL